MNDRLTIRLEHKDKVAFTDYCESNSLCKSKILRNFIKEYVKEVV